MDGVDVAVVTLFADESSLPELLAFETVPYHPSIREALQALSEGRTASAETCFHLHWALGHVFAAAVHDVLNQHRIKLSEIDFIASHGQTLVHFPEAAPINGFPTRGTAQLGEAAVIAEKTGCLTVHDFRAADMAAGGQGAPLVPFFDFSFFAHPEEHRMLLNIGGIANFTFLPAGGGQEAVVAYDCGPGNSLLDALARKYLHQPHDHKGETARQGRVSEELLNWALRHPFLQTAPPKSADRSDFTGNFFEDYCYRGEALKLSPADLLATAVRFTAQTIATEMFRAAKNRPFSVYVSGGGAKNDTLMKELNHFLKPNPIHSLEVLGIPPDAKEAMAIAFLGYCFLRGIPATLPGITGAYKATLAGKLCLPSEWSIMEIKNSKE